MFEQRPGCCGHKDTAAGQNVAAVCSQHEISAAAGHCGAHVALVAPRRLEVQANIEFERVHNQKAKAPGRAFAQHLCHDACTRGDDRGTRCQRFCRSCRGSRSGQSGGPCCRPAVQDVCDAFEGIVAEKLDDNILPVKETEQTMALNLRENRMGVGLGLRHQQSDLVVLF